MPCHLLQIIGIIEISISPSLLLSLVPLHVCSRSLFRWRVCGLGAVIEHICHFSPMGLNPAFIFLYACMSICMLVCVCLWFSDAFLFMKHTKNKWDFFPSPLTEIRAEMLHMSHFDYTINQAFPSLCFCCRFASWLLLTFLSLKTIPVVNLVGFSATHFLVFRLPAEY